MEQSEFGAAGPHCSLGPGIPEPAGPNVERQAQRHSIPNDHGIAVGRLDVVVCPLDGCRQLGSRESERPFMVVVCNLAQFLATLIETIGYRSLKRLLVHLGLNDRSLNHFRTSEGELSYDPFVTS